MIYEIPCEQCDKKYIGLTSCLLKQRISGHKSNMKSWVDVKKKIEMVRGGLVVNTSDGTSATLDEERTRLKMRTAAMKHN